MKVVGSPAAMRGGPHRWEIYCVEARKPEADCTIHEECGTGFCNDSGECEARRKVSERCTEDIECGEGVCYSFDGDKTCTDRIILARSEPLCEELR